jgi:hypothetical protein
MFTRRKDLMNMLKDLNILYNPEVDKTARKTNIKIVKSQGANKKYNRSQV